MSDAPGVIPLFRKRYGVAMAVAGWLPSALSLWKWGWKGGIACLVTTLLVGADFYWLTRTFGDLFAPGTAVPKGAAARALFGIGGRMALLLIGLYATLRVLPGQSGAVAAGLAAPLVCIAVAGVTAVVKG